MAIPSWVTAAACLVADNPSEIVYDKGYPLTVQRRYKIEIEIPEDQNTPELREAWYVANIEGASLTGEDSPFAGVPAPGTAHPTHTKLYALGYKLSVPGYLSKIVFLTVTYERPEYNSQTNNGQVPVPYGSWGLTVSWTTAKLSGADYAGTPFMTKAGEAVNVQCNVPVFTFSRSVKQTSSAILSPSINAVATSIVGYSMPKHCALRTQSNVENTGQDADKYPRILTDQVVYIPRMVSVTSGAIVNATAELATLADVGSYDILILHQGYREKVDGKIQNVSYHDTITGTKTTLNALSVLDADGKRVVPDPNTGVVTPYYLAFQIYPATTW